MITGKRCQSRSQRGIPAGGFSLMELMMVLVIASLLYFVALPGYQHAVIKSTRAAARGVLLDVLARQAEYFIHHKSYALSLGELGLPDPYHIDGQADPVSRSAAAYRIDLVLEQGDFAGVDATPLNGQARDARCGRFSLSLTGVRAVTGSLAARPEHCW